MRILIDMDETIVDMLNPLIKKYNKLHDTRVSFDDIKDYDLSKVMPEGVSNLYNTPGFFLKLQAYKDAVDVIKRLNKKHEIIIATFVDSITAVIDKYLWIETYMPFLDIKQVNIGRHKYLLKADLLIDDNPEFLEKFLLYNPKGHAIRIIRPYNYLLHNSPFFCTSRCLNGRTDYWLGIEELVNITDGIINKTNKKAGCEIC